MILVSTVSKSTAPRWLRALRSCAEQRIEIVEMAHQRGAPLHGDRIAAGDDSPDLVVGQAGGGMDHARVELVGLDAALRVHHHVAHQYQPVDTRVERAQAVGELLRQHRDHPAREIDAGRAGLRFLVEQPARLDVVAHVGDGDQQPPACAGPVRVERFAIDRIVEVARVLAVDGDHRHVAQVDAAAVVRRPQLVRQRSDLAQQLVAELVRHVELAHRDLDLHAGVVDLAEDLDHAPDRRRVLRGRLGDLGRDDLAGRRAHRAARLDHHVVLDALVLGHHQQHAALVDEPAHQAAVGASGDLDDAAFGAAARVGAGPTHQDPVAMHDFLHLAGRQEDVAAAVVGNQEPEAVTMAGDLAGDQVDAADRHQPALAVLQDLAVALHRGQAAAQRDDRFRIHLELHGDFFRRGGGVLRGKQVEDGLAAWWLGRAGHCLTNPWRSLNLRLSSVPRWRNW